MKPVSDKAIILFDGVCNLCNSSVQFVLKHDKKQNFVFAALQSDVARELLLHYPKEIIEKDSIILIQNKKIHTESTAALLIAKEFTGLWKGFQFFWIFPKFLRDFVYRIIAKNRYKWFGKKKACMIPDKSVMDRFKL
ncbi:MAG TPA: thiol-disulfide oxidoreductase DCC family protein [Lutibacter sp.]|nr:thiol-disulfide oxidoreductase DCC family protein [Lutibacter sp.]